MLRSQLSRQALSLSRQAFSFAALVALALFAVASPESTRAASWTLQSMPSPASSTWLEGMTCVAEPACVAVGKEGLGTEKKAQTFMWNGSSWSATGQPYPAETNKWSTLTDASCTSALACTAVGRYRTEAWTDKPYAARFTGSWTIQTVPLPEGATWGALYDVACTSVSACIAVGYYKNASGYAQTLAVAWDGTKWSLKSSPNTSPTKSNELLGVSCSSATACTAVGYGEGLTAPLALRWNGESWSIQEVGLPPKSTAGYFNAVACPGASNCFAVGRYNLPKGGFPPFEVRAYFMSWNGTKWSVLSEPKPAVHEAIFDDISCTSTTACVGVGKTRKELGSIEQRFAANWNGTEWTIHGISNPMSNAFLSGVFCFSATSCEAVGTGPGAIAAIYE